jgi:hypothetical protein
MLLVSAIFHRSWKLLWRGALALGLVVFLISGWWFIRNWILYGDPLGWQTFLSNWEVVRRSGKVTWPDVRAFFDVQFRSYWARFGWMTISAPEWIYRVLLTMVGLSVMGWMRWFWQRRWRSLEDGTQLGVVTLLLFPLLQEAFQIRSIFTFDASWYQGRYLFPAVASLSLIIAIGLWSLVSGWGRQVILGLFGLGLLTFAIITPIAIIRPIYARPTLDKWRVWTLPHRTDVIFGDRIRLLGYRAHQSYSGEVREVDLTLYWQSVQDIDLNYSAFVHVTNEMGKVTAQKDVGLGSEQNYPTSAWWVGDIVPTQHSFTIPLDLPPGCEIRVGVYFWGDQKRLVAVEEGIPIGNFFIIDSSILQDAR